MRKVVNWGVSKTIYHMTPKELDKIILDKMYEGKSHQEVYDDLNARYPNREIDLARLVAAHVSLPQRSKYGTFNIILIVILVINISFGVFWAFAWAMNNDNISFFFSLLFPALYVFLLVGVVRWDLRAYKFIGGLGVLSLIRVSSSAIGGALSASVTFNVMSPLNLLPLGMIVMGFYLYAQLGGKYKTASQQYTDAKGQIRARHQIRFENQ
jgi:hypothetical protein